MGNVTDMLLDTEASLESMVEASGKTIPKPGQRYSTVEHLDYIIDLLGTMVSKETYKAAKKKMANGFNAINDRVEIINYLLSSGEISGDVDIEPITITENGEYTPGAGHAFGRVTVSTPAAEEYDITMRFLSNVEIVNPNIIQNVIKLNNVTYASMNYLIIGSSAFESCSSLTSANFPACTSIGVSAFCNCSSLTSVDFPACTNIGTAAFINCTSLTSANFPACTNIETAAFYSCSSLTSANFPACTNIGTAAFQNCSSLASINFPACTSIGVSAFCNCSSLTSANFPVCTNIGSWAFQFCSSLTSANFPACTSIEVSAFYNCSSLTSANFPACTNIGTAAFSNCSSLASINFPACTSIGVSAFCNCSSLTSVDFPACTNIGTAAFINCTSLTSANFPACTNIETAAFISCYNLISLYLLSSSVCSLSNSNAFTSTPIGGYSASAGRYGSIFVPASLVDAYKTASNWSFYSSRITAYTE